MGAIITIMASFAGFFSQQLVQFDGCLEKDTAGLVNISRTNFYARTGGSTSTNVYVDYAPMVAAINVGVLQSPGDLTSTLSSGCNSGNCTFSDVDTPSFSTVAITNVCEDITARIRIVNVSDPARPIETFLRLNYGNNQSFEWSKGLDNTVVYSWTGPGSNSSDIIAIYFLFRSDRTNTTWRATNCRLFPTINTYAARIKNSQLEENLIDTVPLTRIGAQFDVPPRGDGEFRNQVFNWSHRMTTNSMIRNGTRESCEGSENPASGLTRFMKSSDEATYVNKTGHTNPSAGWKWWYFPKRCDWALSSFSTAAMKDTLKEVFHNQNVSTGYHGGASGSTHLRVLFQEGNITFNTVDQRIRHLATSMTTIIRTNGGAGNFTDDPENAIGTVWNNTTCMYIRWPWLSFQIVLIGLTGVFLVLIAIDNRGIETDRLWKSSFLAALLCEVEVHEKAVGREEMKSIAKLTSVSLEGTSGRLRLVAG
jgi:hypothetical protein